MKSYNPQSLQELIALQNSLPAQTQILSGGTDWIIAHRRKARSFRLCSGSAISPI